MPLERSLADGSARPWMLARALWLAVRLLGWAWQRLTRPSGGYFRDFGGNGLASGVIRVLHIARYRSPFYGAQTGGDGHPA
jgi:hypothetical protein